MYRILLKENSVLREEVRMLKLKLKTLQPSMIFVETEPLVESVVEPELREELDFGPILDVELEQESEPEPEPEPVIELEPVIVSILDEHEVNTPALDSIVTDNIVKYKCIKCGYKYRMNCVLCKNNI